jgi:hypothetical protein
VSCEQHVNLRCWVGAHDGAASRSSMYLAAEQGKLSPRRLGHRLEPRRAGSGEAGRVVHFRVGLGLPSEQRSDDGA